MSRPSSPHKLKFLCAHVCLDSHQNTMVSSLALVCYYREGGSKAQEARSGISIKLAKPCYYCENETCCTWETPRDRRRLQRNGENRFTSVAVPLKCRVGSSRWFIRRRLLQPRQIRLSETRFGLVCNKFPVDGFSRLWAQGLAPAVTLVSLSYSIS